MKLKLIIYVVLFLGIVMLQISANLNEILGEYTWAYLYPVWALSYAVIIYHVLQLIVRRKI